MAIIHPMYKWDPDKELHHAICTKCLKTKMLYIKWDNYSALDCLHLDLTIDETSSKLEEHVNRHGLKFLMLKNIVYKCNVCGANGTNYSSSHVLGWSKYVNPDIEDKIARCTHTHLEVREYKDWTPETIMDSYRDVICLKCGIELRGFVYPEPIKGCKRCSIPSSWAATFVFLIDLQISGKLEEIVGFVVSCDACNKQYEIALDLPFRSYSDADYLHYKHAVGDIDYDAYRANLHWIQ